MQTAQGEISFQWLYKCPHYIEERIEDYFSLTRNRAFRKLKWNCGVVNMFNRRFGSLNSYKCNLLALMQNEFYETFMKEARLVRRLLEQEERLPLQYSAQIDFIDSIEDAYLVIRASDELVYQLDDEDPDRRLQWKYSHFKEYLSFITSGVSLVVLLIEQKQNQKFITLPAISIKDKDAQLTFYTPWNDKAIEAFDQNNFHYQTRREKRRLYMKKKLKGRSIFWQGTFKIHVQPTSILSSYKTELNALIELSNNNRFTNSILDPFRYRDQIQELDQFGEQMQDSFLQFVNLTQSNTNSDDNSDNHKDDDSCSANSQNSSSNSETSEYEFGSSSQSNQSHDDIIKSYNQYQLAAIQEAVDYMNKVLIDFKQITFINGPPGTGKTQTSLGIIGAFAVQQFNYPQQKDLILALGHSNTVVNDFVRKISAYMKEIADLLGEKQSNLKIIRAGRPDKCDDDIAQYSLEILSQNRFFEEVLNQNDIHFLEQFRDHHDHQVFVVGEFNLIKLNQYIENQTRFSRDLVSNDWMEQIEALELSLNLKLKEQYELYQQIQQDILASANIIISTLNSCASDILTKYLSTKLIRMCIIDEAPTASETAALIPIAHYSQIQKLILLGDVKQLGIVTNARDSIEYSFDQSLYERIIQVAFPQVEENQFINISGAFSVIDLLMQYRQMENLAEITSQFFYNGALINGPNIQHMQFPEHYINLIQKQNNSLFFNIKGGIELQDDEQSRSNQIEAQAIVDLVEYLTQNHEITQGFKGYNELFMRKFIKREISIIAAYKAQYYLLKDLLQERDLYKFVDLDTIDAFQGKENNFIIISLVRSRDMGFLKDKRRCNVSLSRAQYGQFIFGNQKLLMNNMNIWRWILQMFEEKNWIRDYDQESADDPAYFRDILMEEIQH